MTKKSEFNICVRSGRKKLPIFVNIGRIKGHPSYACMKETCCSYLEISIVRKDHFRE